MGPANCHQLLCCFLTRSRKLCLRCSSSGYGKPSAVTLPASAPLLPALLPFLRPTWPSLSPPPRFASVSLSDGRDMSVRQSQLFHMPAPWHLSQVTRPVPLQMPQHCSGCPVNSPPICATRQRKPQRPQTDEVVVSPLSSEWGADVSGYQRKEHGMYSSCLTLPRALQTGHSRVVAPMHRRHRIGLCIMSHVRCSQMKAQPLQPAWN